MSSIITKFFTTFFIFGILITLPSFAVDAPDQIEYQGNTITKMAKELELFSL